MQRPPGPGMPPLPPGMIPAQMGPRGPMPRMLPPEVMAAFAQGMPRQITPEMLARMPLPPPEVLARLPGVPPGLAPNAVQALMASEAGVVSNGTAPLDPEKEEKQKAIRLLQAVCKCITGCLVRDFRGIRAEYYKLLPMLCNHDTNENEPHLARDCLFTLGYMAQSILPMGVIPACLEAITQVSKSGSWKARASVLELLQVTVFLNMPSFLSSGSWVDQVMDVVENCLKDERVEVRSKAGQVLGGLLHCNFVSQERQDSLLKSFYAKVGRSTKKKKSKKTPEDIVAKHSAVLGLCSFVNAFPYDVPEFIPNVLMVLSDHLHDLQPIPVTIKKTLQDFKRTHQDNWQDHKLKFSDDQLAVLTDLLVSPSYYA